MQLNAAVGLLLQDDVTVLPFAVDLLLNFAGPPDGPWNLNVAIRGGVQA